MALEVVFGESRDRNRAKLLAVSLAKVVDQGTVYLGYPVLATADERVDIDALLVSRDRGVAAFIFAPDQPASTVDWEQVVDEQDRLFSILESNLRKHESLRSGRGIAVAVRTATIFVDPVTNPLDSQEGAFLGQDEVQDWISGFGGINGDLERRIQAALPRVTTIKPAKRRTSVKREGTRGAILKIIEKEIANLDRWQKSAAIESPEGPQRIRGLAGSGKTVVLALKAAILHAQHPDWQIAVTFQSRALYQQFEDLVTRFSFEHMNDRFDPEYLRIMHAWGSTSKPGLYSAIANHVGFTPRDFGFAKSLYGMENAFQGVCRELLDITEGGTHAPLFDVVLIDEAQDLPPEFFRLIRKFTKDPKRVVWGYDELQKLSESSMPTTDELFGLGEHGEPLVSIENRQDEPRRDVVLQFVIGTRPGRSQLLTQLDLGCIAKKVWFSISTIFSCGRRLATTS